MASFARKVLKTNGTTIVVSFTNFIFDRFIEGCVSIFGPSHEENTRGCTLFQDVALGKVR